MRWWMLALGASLWIAPACAQQHCAALSQLRLQDAVIEHAEPVEGSEAELPGFGPRDEVPAFCRVRGVARPSADSRIHFEVWLPQAGWNGRVLDVGNGGFAGSLYYGQMASNVRHGYATAGSDAGHEAGAEDASWAYHHPEKVADFGWRAVHVTAGLSRQVVKAFYGRAQRKAYFDACSDGGREALMEAQRFPEDYDGILAGAPANNWARMLAGGLALVQRSAQDPAAYLPAAKLPAITRASLAACDAQDGLRDGIVSDPEHCHFRAETLRCQDEDTAACLTAPQVATLKAIYTGGATASGQLIFPGLVPGDENPGWANWVLGPAPGAASGANYMTGYFRYMVLGEPTWNPLTADAGVMEALALERTSKDVDATEPDLSRFAARGGRLILYHGWNDPAISPWNSVTYFQAAGKAMGTARRDSVFRLYMVPGMEHCSGGPGPNLFGQLGSEPAAGAGTGALEVLQQWVEEGRTPGAILATKRTPGATPEAARDSGGLVRPICPYPQRAVLLTHHQGTQPEDFVCRAD